MQGREEGRDQGASALQRHVARTDEFHENVPVGVRPIPELTIFVVTSGPHAAVCLQHHAVGTTGSQRYRVSVCKNNRLGNAVDC